jgi:hypothetical protein
MDNLDKMPDEEILKCLAYFYDNLNPGGYVLCNGDKDRWTRDYVNNVFPCYDFAVEYCLTKEKKYTYVVARKTTA